MKSKGSYIFITVIFLVTMMLTPITAYMTSSDEKAPHEQEKVEEEELTEESGISEAETMVMSEIAEIDVAEDEVETEVEPTSVESETVEEVEETTTEDVEEEVVVEESEEVAEAETTENPIVIDENEETELADENQEMTKENQKVVVTGEVVDKEPDVETKEKDDSDQEVKGAEKGDIQTDNVILQTEVIDVQNYFTAEGVSTNSHYSVVGVYIATNDDVHLLLDNNKNTANQTRFYNPMLNENEAAGYGSGSNGYEPFWNGTYSKMTLRSTDGSTTNINGVRMFDFNLGPMIDLLKSENTLQMLNGADGFSIRGMTFSIDLGHEIEKNVNEDSVTIDDEIIYTIKVKNIGNYRLTGMNVYDDVPEGIKVIATSEDENQVDWTDQIVHSGGVVNLDTDLTLEKDKSKTYYIKAQVEDDVYDGQKIINTAYTGGSVPRQEDTAEVNIYVESFIESVLIKKLITGNLGHQSREFPFTVIANKDSEDEQTFTFDLSHNDSFELKKLPKNTTLILSEEAGDYEATVTIAKTKIPPNSDGEYVIKLSDENVEITVTNHKDVTIDTGISLDSLPFVLIIATVTTGLLIMFVRRRKFSLEDE